ncbi:hypothetical protein TWF506_008974 [Arthrobotrys conoides]|uniref:F-box domain-containing protein n=1 Tax=Arthrobotrys conoides TaxID=74498 RepID=A0AAN8NUF3_9PEZI
MPTLFIPLEIQYHILSFAIQDWLSQPSLRKVCRSWQLYIDTSPEAFSARYTNTLCHKEGQEEFWFEPQFHNAVAYCHQNFYKTQEDPPKFSPCVFEINEEDGDVMSVSLEIDLEIFSKDPIYKPADIKSRSGPPPQGHHILPPLYMTILYSDIYSFRHPWYYGPRPPYQDLVADAEFTKTATVGDFLKSIPEIMDLMMEYLYLGSKVSIDGAAGGLHVACQKDRAAGGFLQSRNQTGVTRLGFPVDRQQDQAAEQAMSIKYFETSMRVGSCHGGDQGLFLFVREVNGGRGWPVDFDY